MGKKWPLCQQRGNNVVGNQVIVPVVKLTNNNGVAVAQYLRLIPIVVHHGGFILEEKQGRVEPKGELELGGPCGL